MVQNPPLNQPALWANRFPWPQPEGHKYDRGHVVVLGGPVHSAGAARLAARAALRSGAGLVSVACPAAALTIYATSLQSVMTKKLQDAESFAALIADPRICAVLIGPGAGVTDFTRACVLSALQARKPCVLDADALSVWADAPESLFVALHPSCILTPHAGEFARLFGPAENRLSAVRAAARRAGCVVLLKGAETWIADALGRVVAHRHATPFLATAGAGDVLAGLCAGLMAQGMPVFDAACAAAWMQGDAALRFGPGLIAEDLIEGIPAVLKALWEAKPLASFGASG